MTQQKSFTVNKDVEYVSWGGEGKLYTLDTRNGRLSNRKFNSRRNDPFTGGRQRRSANLAQAMSAFDTGVGVASNDAGLIADNPSSTLVAPPLQG